MPSFSCSSSSDIWNRALSVSWCVAPTAQELWANSLTLLPIARLTSPVKLHCTTDTSQEWVTTGALTGSLGVNMWTIKWPKWSVIIPNGWNQHFTTAHKVFAHKDGINSIKWRPRDSLVWICTIYRVVPWHESPFCPVMIYILMRYVALFQDGLYLLSTALYTQELLLLDCSEPWGCLAPTGGELSSLSNSNFHWCFSVCIACKQQTEKLQQIQAQKKTNYLHLYIYFFFYLHWYNK